MKKNLTLLLALAVSIISNAQTKITSYTFGAMEARWLGPGTMSGRITAIDGVSADSKTLYVGTAGGGIWKSTNAGASFKPIFEKYCQSIGAIAIDQKKPATVYAATGESNMRNSVSIGNGIYKSTDEGDNWTKIGLDSTEHISKIVIDPKNSDIIYVSAPGPLWGDSKHRGLYKSTNAGESWEKILYVNEKTGCADVSVDPQNPNIIYATTWEFRRFPYAFNSGGQGSGIWKSTDAGKTWKQLEKGLPAKPFGRVALAVSPSAPKNLLAIVESKETGLYYSTDGGDTWKPQSATMNVVSRPFYFSTLLFDPKDSNRVYRPGFGFSYSNDGGHSFADASYDGGWVHSDMHALWINPNYTNQMYLGTDGGVYYSLDRGATWMFVQNLPVGQFYHVAVDNAKPYRMYGGLQDNGSWYAPSSAPGGISNASWIGINGGDGFWAVPDLTDPNIAYAESQGGEMNQINLTTLKSLSIAPKEGKDEEKLRWNWNTPIVTGQANHHNLYTAAQYLYKSTNQGRDWERISPDLTTNDKKKQQQEESGGLSEDNTSAENHCTIFTVTESPLDENMIWAGTDDGNLQLTTNGGKNWTNLSKNYVSAGIPAQTWVSSIEPSRFDKNTVYVTFDNHMYGDMKTYLGKSTDAGKTWKLITSEEFTGFAHKVKEDIVNKQLLFLGTEMGLFATEDGGESWFRMKNHIPDYCLVRDIQIQPETNDLVLATHGRGIIVVNDITPMRNLTKELAQNDVYVFPMAAMPLSNGKYGGGGASSPGGWDAGNPDEIQPIQYYLKDRVSSGEVKMEIYDAQGKLVQTLPASKRKGVNKVYWNMRYTPPKIAKGGSKVDFAGFTAPMVEPGSYTAKLKISNKEYNIPLTTIHDSANTKFSIEDRAVQYKAAMELYHMHEDLYALVEKINDEQKILKEHIDSTKNLKTKKLLTEYNVKLETLRSTLLATKHKSIFADEKKLREEISAVYNSVCYQECKPSNLQLNRISVLKEEEKKGAENYKALNTEYAAKVKEAIDKDQAVKDYKPSVSRSGGN
ncbi:MAG: glycosyl hydrolase [Bacteroidota bacterium]